MLRPTTIALYCALLLPLTPALAGDIRNYQILDTRNIPENITELEPSYIQEDAVLSAEDHYSNFVRVSKKKKIKQRSCKKFGPVKVNFLVNPLRMNRTGITFDIDLLESMEILSGNHSMQEIKTKFRASPQHNIVTDEVKAQIHRVAGWFNKQEAS